MTAGLVSLLIAIFAPPAEDRYPCDEVECGSFDATVRLTGHGGPVEGVRVFVLPAAQDARLGKQRSPTIDDPDEPPAWMRATETDEEGRFSVDGVPRGQVRVVVVGEGVERQEWIIDSADPPRRRGFELFAELENDRFRTVVTNEVEESHEPPRITTTELSLEELETVPGSQGDPLRAIQNLPGVLRVPGGVGEIILRGAAPWQNLTYVGAHPVPRAFHLLGLTSVVPSGLVDKLEVAPGNYDAFYGHASGGLVNIVPRAGRRDGVHGYGELDLAAASAFVEGPLGRGSFVAATQRGYFDAAVAVARRVDPNARYSKPSYQDYQLMWDYAPDRSTELGVHVLGSWDRMVEINPFSNNDPFELRTGWHRLDLTYRRRIGPTYFLISPAFRFDTARTFADRPNVSGGIVASAENRRFDWIPALRAEMGRRLSRRLAVRAGADASIDWFRVQNEGEGLDEGEVSDYSETIDGRLFTGGVYLAATLNLGPFRIDPAVRFSAYSFEATDLHAIDPRLAVRYEAARVFAFRAGAGFYSGPRIGSARSEADIVQGVTYLPGGSVLVVPNSITSLVNGIVAFEPRRLSLDRALQVSAGPELDFPHEIQLTATGFMRRRAAGATNLSGPRANARWLQWDYGLEAMLRKRLTRKLYAWLGYTLLWARSVRREQPFYEARQRPASYDQRHNFVLIASYALPRNWRIGARFRFATGIPYTPIIGSVASGTFYNPIFGSLRSARYPNFHQLDLRVDKRWYVGRVSVLAYLDVQNLYNRQNTEVFLYSPDYSEQVGAVGMPVFPTFGLRVEW